MRRCSGTRPGWIGGGTSEAAWQRGRGGSGRVQLDALHLGSLYHAVADVRLQVGRDAGDPTAVETVSRLFTRFQEQGLVRVERKHIQIIDRDTLEAVVAGQPNHRDQ